MSIDLIFCFLGRDT